MNPDGTKAQVGLQNQVRLWPTPSAGLHNDAEEAESFMTRRERLKALGMNGNGAGIPLAIAAKIWPTPAATDGEKAPKFHKGGNLSLPESARTWSTPRSSDGEKGGPNQAFGAGGTPLPAQAAQWRTPQAMDAERGSNGTWQPKPQAGQHSLRHQIEKWSTPRSLEVGQYTRDNGDPEKQRPSLTGHAFSLPAPATSTAGATFSPERRSLNPLFVEWLMGWPPGWTNCACSATAFARYRRDMQSALSRLVSPAEAPPAQLSLLG